MTCPACHKPEPCTCSTTRRLAALGLTHRATGRGYEHAVLRGDVEVTRGTAHGVEKWLSEGGGR